MPPKLSSSEKPIAARLRQWRRWAGWSQHDLASSLGCKRDLLAAYEAGRAAVPWPLVQRLALAHRVNPEWLYSGDGEPEGSFDLEDALTTELPSKTRFSEAWRQIREHPGHRAAERAVTSAIARLESAATELHRIVAEVVPAARQRAAIRRALDLAQNALVQLDIQTAAVYPAGDTPAVGKPQDWERLLTRMRAATAKPGAKSALARQLGVPRQNVTAWLQGRKQPNALSTLRLAKLFPESAP